MGIKKYRMKTILIITAVFPPEPIVSSQLSLILQIRCQKIIK